MELKRFLSEKSHLTKKELTRMGGGEDKSLSRNRQQTAGPFRVDFREFDTRGSEAPLGKTKLYYRGLGKCRIAALNGAFQKKQKIFSKQ